MTTTYKNTEINDEEFAIQRLTDGADGKDMVSVDKTTGTVTMGHHDIADSAIFIYNNETPPKYVGLKPGTVVNNQDYELPTDDGSSGEVLTTNGSAVLSWSTPPTDFVELRYGLSATVTNDTQEFKLVNGVTLSYGWRLPDDCSAAYMTLQTNCSSHSSNGTFSAEIYKNNVATGETVTSDTVTGTGTVGGSGSVSESFAKGDTCSVFITVPSTFSVKDTLCLVKFTIS